MDILAFRSDLVKAIRSYFESEKVDEVTTPLLRPSGAVETHLDSLSTCSSPSYFLQTSPEYAMKVVLAKYRRSIYQICPAIRAGESSQKHQIEFQVLEWYRYSYDLARLAEDLQNLLGHICRHLASRFDLKEDFVEICKISYKELFFERYGINPHRASTGDLKELAIQAGVTHIGLDANKSDYLDGLFSFGIEPSLRSPVIVCEFPSCQASLAEVRIDNVGDKISCRFELIANGLEIANAYQELDDAAELEKRFFDYNLQRRRLGKVEMDVDEVLLDSMGSIGIYSGIALGIDRLAMSLLGSDAISDVTL